MGDSDLSSIIKSIQNKTSSILNAFGLPKGAPETFKLMTDNVTDLDSTLTDLAKAASLSSTELAMLTETAYTVGERISRAGKEVLETTASFKRAGYEIKDSLAFAEEALKLENISNDLGSTEQAVSRLIQIMKGFGSESPVFARHINDAVSNVSLQEGIDFDTLFDGAAKLSEAAGKAGVSFDQMLGTLAAGYQSLGSMDQAVSGQLAIFSNLGTGGDGQIQNAYDSLKQLAAEWTNLDKQGQHQLSVEIAGDEQTDVFRAIMENWNNVENSVKSATESFGMADIQNEQYLNSIAGKVENFQSAFQHLSNTAIDSDFLKGAIDSGTKLVTILDKVIETFGTLPLLIGKIGSSALTKNGLDYRKIRYNANLARFR